MTLAERLRRALDEGGRRQTVLLMGDERETLLEAGETISAAAVLVAVVDRPEPTLILTRRNETLRRHAGQVAFPGGRIDPEDDGPVAAALREAHEEIGLDPAQVEVVGIFEQYRTVTGFEVTPVVGVVPPGLVLTPHDAEVAQIFEVPLAFVCEPGNHLEQTVEWQGRERHYFEILWEDQRIWGATAAMIVNLARSLAYA